MIDTVLTACFINVLVMTISARSDVFRRHSQCLRYGKYAGLLPSTSPRRPRGILEDGARLTIGQRAGPPNVRGLAHLQGMTAGEDLMKAMTVMVLMMLMMLMVVMVVVLLLPVVGVTVRLRTTRKGRSRESRSYLFHTAHLAVMLSDLSLALTNFGLSKERPSFCSMRTPFTTFLGVRGLRLTGSRARAF